MNRSTIRPVVRFLVVLACGAFLVGRASGQERFRRTPPIPDPLQELRLPTIETRQLANGLTVAALPSLQGGLMTIQVVIAAGEADSPPELPGLASLTARMIGKGTKVLSAEDIENLTEGMGAEFSVSATMDETVFKMQVLEEFLDRGLLILRQMLLEPVFSERQLAGIKRDYYYELREKRRDPEAAAERQFLRLLFQGHAYASAAYSEDVIRSVTARDTAAFYSGFYRPGNTTVVVSGRIGLNVAARKVSQHFNMWTPGGFRRTAREQPAPNEANRICFLERPEAEEAAVVIGNSIPARASDPDYFPFIVLNQALGGTTRSRLFMKLREARGYAYYAFSSTEFYGACGAFWARARTDPESITNVIREVTTELSSLASGGLPPSEVEEAKSYLIGNLPLKLDSPGYFDQRVAGILSLGLGREHWERVIDNIMLVSQERVQQVAGKYLARSPLVVVAGRMEWLGEILKEFDSIEVFDSLGNYKLTLTKGESHAQDR